MAKKEESHLGMVAVIGSAVAALGGIVTAIVQLQDDLHSIVESFETLSPAVWGATLAILVAALFIATTARIRRRSRLAQPDALTLRANDPHRLKGRIDDITNLSGLCGKESLVHLVGESGSGKSALVLAGLIPELHSHGRMLPVYLAGWGGRWDDGPRGSLWDALRRTLDDTHFVHAGVGEIGKVLEDCRPKLGRIPILIFDQFDDYLSRHRQNFEGGQLGALLSCEELTMANDFWAEIAALTAHGAIRCLFVVRDDASYALEVVRFARPRQYYLSRLPQGFVEPLLNELTADNDLGEVVRNPEGGWNRLKSRLAKDLGRDGTVLPAQMKVVFQALHALGALTIGHYERAGGLSGLEAAHVEAEVAKAGVHSGLGKDRVRRLLLAMVDPNSQKTKGCSPKKFVQLLAEHSSASQETMQQPLKAALSDLENAGLIRQRLEPDTDDVLWTLDHDYLCRGVLEAQRKADRWYVLLDEGRRAFLDAGASLPGRWRALLRPWHQTRLLWERLRGRIRYGDNRAFALTSTLRFLPQVLLLAFLALGLHQFNVGQQIEQDRQDAGDIMAVMETEDPERLSRAELHALWRLATRENENVRQKVLLHSLGARSDAQSFNLRADILVHAALGFDRRRRATMLQRIVIPCLRNPSQHREVNIACARMTRQVWIDGAGKDAASAALKELLGALINGLEERAADEMIDVAGMSAKKAEPKRAFALLLENLPALTAVLTQAQVKKLVGELLLAAGGLPVEERAAAFQQTLVLWAGVSGDTARLLYEVLKALSRHLAPQARYLAVIQALDPAQSKQLALYALLAGGVLSPGDFETTAMRDLLDVLLAADTREAAPKLNGESVAHILMLIGRLGESEGKDMLARLEALTDRHDISLVGVGAPMTRLVTDSTGYPEFVTNWLFENLTKRMRENLSYRQRAAKQAGALAGIPGVFSPEAADGALEAMLYVVRNDRTAEDNDRLSPQHFESIRKGLHKAVQGIPPQKLVEKSRKLISVLLTPPDEYSYAYDQFYSLATGLTAVLRRLGGIEAEQVRAYETQLRERTNQHELIILQIANLAIVGSVEHIPPELVHRLTAGQRAPEYRALLLDVLRASEPALAQALLNAISSIPIERFLPFGREFRSVMRERNATLPADAAARLYEAGMKRLWKRETKVDLAVIEWLAQSLSPDDAARFAKALAEEVKKAEYATASNATWAVVLRVSVPMIEGLAERLSADAALDAAIILIRKSDFGQVTMSSFSERAMQALVPRLTAQGRGRVAFAMVRAWRESHRPGRIPFALDQAAFDLEPAEGQKLSRALVEMLEKNSDRETLRKVFKPLQAAAATLSEGQAEALLETVTEVILSLDDPDLISAYARVLAVCPVPASRAQAEAVTGHIVGRIEKTPTLSKLPLLIEALDAAPRPVVQRYAEDVFIAIEARMLDARSWPNRASLAEAIEAVPGTIPEQRLIEWLKWPTSVESLRSALLTRLQQHQGKRSFDDDIWTMVEWAERSGLDVTSNPKHPEATE